MIRPLIQPVADTKNGSLSALPASASKVLNNNIRVKIYRSITDVDETKWDAIVAKDSIICAHKYIELVEKAEINKGKCYYPVVYDGDEIIAHTSVYLMSTEIDIFARGIIKKSINMIRRTWRDFFTLCYFECGSPSTAGNPISIKDGVDRAQTLQILCHEIEKLAKEHGIKLTVLRDFYDGETAFHNIIGGLGYKKIHNLPKAELKVRWKNFDEYLNSMRSSYRSKIVKNIKQCSGVDISIREPKDVSARYAHEMKRLHDNVSIRAKEVKREPLGTSFFQNLDKYLGERSAVALATKDEKVIGFMLLLLNDKELVSSVIGLDYDYNEKYSIYFNLFYKTIEFGLKKGVNKIGLGFTTLEPKKALGADVINLNMFMKHSNPILNKVIPVLFDMITPPDTTGQRNVFKEDRPAQKSGQLEC